jgi:hypothetical protein
MDAEHTLWEGAFGGAELADLCNLSGTYWAPPSIGYTIARSWSNAAARQQRNPCIPTPAGEPYFNSFPATPDAFFLYGIDGALPTHGIQLRIGETKTVDVMLFSDSPTDGPWEVGAHEIPALPQRPNVLTLALDRTSGINGEKLHLTVTANADVERSTTSIVLSSMLGDRQALWSTPVFITP